VGFEITKINTVMKHIHHIIPQYLGGTNDPSNLIELSVEEHAEAHRKLFEEHGNWQDRIAWLALSGQIGKDDALREARGAANRGRKRTPEQLANMKKASQARAARHMADPEFWLKVNRKKSESHKGKQKSPEHMANWSAARKGHAVSDETREKIRRTLAETRAKKTPY
jgi:hypothetical protein